MAKNKPNPFAKAAAPAKTGKSPAPKGGVKGGKAALFQPKGGRGMVAPPARKAK